MRAQSSHNVICFSNFSRIQPKRLFMRKAKCLGYWLVCLATTPSGWLKIESADTRPPLCGILSRPARPCPAKKSPRNGPEKDRPLCGIFPAPLRRKPKKWSG